MRVFAKIFNRKQHSLDVGLLSVCLYEAIYRRLQQSFVKKSGVIVNYSSRKMAKWTTIHQEDYELFMNNLMVNSW